MKEWKDIQNYEGLYQVSSEGEIKSLRKGVLLMGSKREYHMVNLQNKSLSIHRLVALAFLPNPLNLPSINHKNGLKYDNRVENLEWCTGSQNIQHALNVIKTFCVGERHKRSKLTELDVYNMRIERLVGISLTWLAKKYSVSSTTIQRAVRRISWKHVA